MINYNVILVNYYMIYFIFVIKAKREYNIFLYHNMLIQRINIYE